MRSFPAPLFVMLLLFLSFQSCKKDLATASEAELDVKDNTLSDFIATNSMHTVFEEISSPTGSYLSTTQISVDDLSGGDNYSSITNGILSVNFSEELIKADPGSGTQWGVPPQVESEDPHSLYYFDSNPLELTLSHPVKTFGFELFWNGLNSFSVEYYNGTSLLGTVTRSFTPGSLVGSARLFAASAQANVINRIVFKPGVDINSGFLIAQVRYFIAPPPPPVQKIVFDVQPGSCENNFNTKSQGVTPMVIYGSSNLNVSDINLSTIRINGVAPLRSSFERIGAPYAKVNDCDCSAAGSDNIMDLALKFDTQALVPSLAGVADGQRTTIIITGKLRNGTDFEGRDCVRVKRK
jgi:hypothetical protein